MAWYEYLCSSGHRFDLMRPVDQRDALAICPQNVDGLPASRVYSVPTIHWPRALWTQWSDVHGESPRELARRKDIERYDPSGPVQSPQSDRPALERAFKDAVTMHGGVGE